jgi:hypothetical protein
MYTYDDQNRTVKLKHVRTSCAAQVHDVPRCNVFLGKGVHLTLLL